MSSMDKALGIGLDAVELRPHAVRWTDIARRWQIVVGITAFAVAGSVAWLAVARPIYQSTSVMVTSPNDNRLRSIEASNPLSEMLEKNYDLSLATHLSLLKESDLQTTVANKIGGTVDTNKGNPADKVPIVVKGNRYALAFENPTDTELLAITVQGNDPQLAAKIAQTYADDYIRQVHDMQLSDFRQAEVRASKSLDRATASLNLYEENLERLRRAHGLTDLDQTLASQIQDYSALKTKYDTVSSNLAAARHQSAVARQQLRSLPTVDSAVLDVNADQAVAGLLLQLRQKQVERLNLLKTYRPATNVIKNINQQIELLQNQLDQSKKEALTRNKRENPSWVTARQNLFQLEVEQKGLESQITQIKTALARSQARLHQFPQWQLQYGIAQRKVDLSKDRVVELQKVLDDLALRKQTRPDLIRVVQHADIPTDPVAPNKPLTLAFGTMLGVMLGLFAAAGTATRNRFFLDAGDASSSLGLRLLGQTPTLPARKVAPNELDVNSMESLRSVYANLRILCDTYEARSIVIAPVRRDTRSAWLAASIAGFTASTEGQTILADTDATSAWITKHYRLEGKPGLSDVLLGSCSLSQARYSVGSGGLQVIPVGSQQQALPDLLTSSSMARLIGTLKDLDVITILSASGQFGEMAVPAAFADAMVMVVDHNLESREEISSALNAFTAASARVVGMVDCSGLHSTMLPEVVAPKYAVAPQDATAFNTTAILPDRSKIDG